MPIGYLYILGALVLFLLLWYRPAIKEGFGVFGLGSTYSAGPDCGYCHQGSVTANDLNSCDVKKPQYSADESGIVQTPDYLKNPDAQPMPESEAYAYGVIQRQGKQIRDLRKQLKKMAEKLDEGMNPYYQRKLSNKYYKPKPFLSDTQDTAMNLGDDDFSNKTLSTVKFLSHTRSSKFFGDEIHFPSELCGNYCTTSDPNAQFHEQLDLIRPVKPTDYVPTTK